MALFNIEKRYTLITQELERLRAEAAAYEILYDNDSIKEINDKFEEIAKILDIG